MMWYGSRRCHASKQSEKGRATSGASAIDWCLAGAPFSRCRFRAASISTSQTTRARSLLVPFGAPAAVTEAAAAAAAMAFCVRALDCEGSGFDCGSARLWARTKPERPRASGTAGRWVRACDGDGLKFAICDGSGHWLVARCWACWRACC